MEAEGGQGKESGYLHIVNGENYIGGVPPANQHSADEPSHWLLYFAVPMWMRRSKKQRT